MHKTRKKQRLKINKGSSTAQTTGLTRRVIDMGGSIFPGAISLGIEAKISIKEDQGVK